MTAVAETTGEVPTDATTAADGEIPTRVLVLGMAHENGTILAEEVYPVAEACGLTAEQVRSCLRRLVNEGLFTRDGEGRDAEFGATEAGLAALGSMVERTRLAYVQDQAGKGWDRNWRLVAFAIPEARRTARDAFRDRLIQLGGAAIHNGLYVSPHRWDDDVLGVAARLGVAEHVTLAVTDELRVGGIDDPSELAHKLWPVEELARRYEAFCERYERLPDALENLRKVRHEKITDAAFYSGALRMGVQWQSVFNIDPLLPPELLPRPWPGRRARDILARSRRLALRIREDTKRPALWAHYDDIIDRLY